MVRQFADRLLCLTGAPPLAGAPPVHLGLPHIRAAIHPRSRRGSRRCSRHVSTAGAGEDTVGMMKATECSEESVAWQARRPRRLDLRSVQLAERGGPRATRHPMRPRQTTRREGTEGKQARSITRWISSWFEWAKQPFITGPGGSPDTDHNHCEQRESRRLPSGLRDPPPASPQQADEAITASLPIRGSCATR
jgi:hypothetical protein